MSCITIEISNNQCALEIEESQLKRTVECVLRRMDVSEADVSVAIVDDGAISEIKERFFGTAQATDVISFDLGEGDQERPFWEVLVNAECAVRMAEERSAEPQGELNLYIVHGLLHQLGYDDQSDSQSKAMHEEEDKILEELGFGKVFRGNRVNGSG